MKHRPSFIALTVLAFMVIAAFGIVPASFGDELTGTFDFHKVVSIGQSHFPDSRDHSWNPPVAPLVLEMPPELGDISGTISFPSGPERCDSYARMENGITVTSCAPSDDDLNTLDDSVFGHLRAHPSDPNIFIYEKPWYLILPSEENPEPWYLVQP